MTTYTKEQQAENRAKWVAALRSGEFKQGQNKLQRMGEYCCLGVACELAVTAGVISSPEIDEDDDTAYYDGEPDELPESVRDWLGLRDLSGSLVDSVFYGDTVAGTLINLNDEVAYTFGQIAGVIESGNVGLADE